MKKLPRICRTCYNSFFPQGSEKCYCTLEMDKRGKVQKRSINDSCLKYIADAYFSMVDIRRCRVCGCTDDDCSGCIEKTGEPCHWVEWDLCSACADEMQEGGEND